MATKNNRYTYTFTTLLFLFLFLFTIFLFSKRALEPPIFLYRNFFSQISPSSSSLQNATTDLSFPELNPESTGPEPAEAPIGEPFLKDLEIHNNNTNGEVFEENVKNPSEENGRIDENEGDLWLDRGKMCDLYSGTWVRDEEYPIYEAGSCPYVDEAFDCQNNGRSDSEYLKWRWKPDGCDLPRFLEFYEVGGEEGTGVQDAFTHLLNSLLLWRDLECLVIGLSIPSMRDFLNQFNATDFLERLRGKKLMLVGDSVNRNQFESILCLLRQGLHNKSRMYETRGHKITKGRGYYVFKFEDYNCTLDFVRSHFLVREGVRVNGDGNSNPTLSIDRIDKTSGRWKRADILIFNTGHWWTHGKTARGKNYYKEGDYLYPKFDSVEAYRRSLKTWGKWIDVNVNPKKQLVFYRGYSTAHFRGGDWDSGGSCNGETEPAFRGAILNNYPVKMKIVEEVIKGMKIPVKLLNVTSLTNFRKDGHPSIYGKKVSTRRQDCSHWCLPGVPDTWNELIYASLVFHQTSH